MYLMVCMRLDIAYAVGSIGGVVEAHPVQFGPDSDAGSSFYISSLLY